ncbi:putative serine/threonine-protein kinase [Ditylenchus destructor]|nr:putative serine/threonine-protein kinase [Ditylenchus destructor]
MTSSLSPMFADLIKSLLIRDPKDRLGANGASDVKAHHFFFGFNWKQLQKQEMDAPIVPKYDAKGNLYYRDTVVNEDLYLRPGATA